MSVLIRPRAITVNFDDSGNVRATRGDVFAFTDDAGKPITPKFIGTKNSFTQDELEAAFPHAELVAQVSSLTVDKTALIAERDALAAAQTALITERDTLATEKDALTAERDALTAERDALAPLAAQVESLKAQLVTVLGVPVFDAADILVQMTAAEKDAITVTVAKNDELRPLWTAFLGRVKGAKISLNNATFQAALSGLQSIIGAERVVEMFARIKIDIVNGKYIVS